MKFKIVEAPEERLKSTRTIPLQYCNAISSFAKPRVIKSTYLDILYHDRSIKGCVLRNIVFYVKEPVTLLISTTNPMLSINCMIRGNIDVQLNGLEKISLQQGEYNILQMSSEDHALILEPGVYELQRYDYARRIIAKEKPEWLDKLENNESAILEHGVIDERFSKRQDKLKHKLILSLEQEEWLYKKLRKYLHQILEEHSITNE